MSNRTRNHPQSQAIMNSRQCQNCNAIETAEHRLHACTACNRVAYCNKACQKKHWKPHRPICRAAVQQDHPSDEDSDVDEVEDQNQDMANDDPIDDDAANSNSNDLVGTSIEYFTLPTSAHRNGHKTTIS